MIIIPKFSLIFNLGSCRGNCFRNEDFLKCLDVLLYAGQKNELNSIADSLYGS